jgi:hypothetical protein
MPAARSLPQASVVTNRRFALAALLATVVAGCGAGSGEPGASSLTTQIPAASPTASPPVGGTGGGGTGGGGTGGGGTGGGTGGGGGGSGGGGANTVVYQWQDATDRSGNGVQDLLTSSYRAVVAVTLTKTDTYAYDIKATAAVSATFTEDYTSNCSHYTDDASGSGTVSGQGGLQAGDVGETYEFFIDLLGATGTNHTVRDDSPCNGPNYADDPEWPVPPVHVSASDSVADPHHIWGTMAIPRDGGTESVTWDFVLP